MPFMTILFVKNGATKHSIAILTEPAPDYQGAAKISHSLQLDLPGTVSFSVKT